MKPPFYMRYIIIVLICGILGAGIVVQMIRINYSPSARELIAKSQNYQGVEETVYPPRGTIYDRKGHVLATNQIAYEVGIDLKFVTDPEFDRVLSRQPARTELCRCFRPGKHDQAGTG